MQTIVKNTNELTVGDHVLAHGVIFELTEENQFADCYTKVGKWFKTKVIAQPYETVMPKHWMETWTIQGNGNAKWQVLTGAA